MKIQAVKFVIHTILFCIILGLASCGVYLPHSSIGLNSSILSKPIRKGEDTSCFTVEAGRSESWFVDPNENNWWDSVHYPIINSSLNNYYAEVSWIKCHEHLLYGSSLFGYVGEYKTWTDRQITSTADYYGLGTKLLIGMNMNYEHVNFQPIFLQTSFAKDFGTYVSIRENFEPPDDKADVAPADAIAIT